MFRGVAGSGKSLMLALNAARTLMELEKGEGVLVCCFNKTLVPFLRQNIEDRHARLVYDYPDPESCAVTHFERLMKLLAEQEPALDTGLTFKDADKRAVEMASRFDALPTERQRALQYAAVYLDEAQDLRPDEIRLLRRLARPDEKGGQTFLIFCDNAQNIYGVATPIWDKLGVEIVGRTTYLDQCMRNTRQIIELPFNVLVGSHAPDDHQVTTRQFADVRSLRERGLIEEKDGLFRASFTPRQGEHPDLRLFKDRASESAGVGELVRHWVQEQRVWPSDILVLHTSHYHHPDLEKHLRLALGNAGQVRRVDKANEKNKTLPLIERGMLTMSTLHSAKGYDAPLVILVGCDRIKSDTEGRAQFYVGATRAKHHLVLTGIAPTAGDSDRLMPEIVATAAALGILPKEPKARETPTAPATRQCRHCGSTALHGQHGPYGYYFRCIACDQDTPMPRKCPTCSQPGKVRKSGPNFHFRCPTCGESLIHTNGDLNDMPTSPGPMSGQQ